MKKLIYFLSLCLITIMLCSCGQSNKRLENMTTQENNNYVAIIFGNRTYVPFCAIDYREQGTQIGIVNGNKNDQVYKYKGYPTDDWNNK